MTKGRATIAAAVVGVAMALAAAGIAHTGQTKAIHVVAGDMRGSDDEQAGREMASSW
jgi:hypothetical protein